MNETNPNKPAQEAISDTGGTALAALAKVFARAVARTDFAAGRNAGLEQHDEDPDHE